MRQKVICFGKGSVLNKWELSVFVLCSLGAPVSWLLPSHPINHWTSPYRSLDAWGFLLLHKGTGMGPGQRHECLPSKPKRILIIESWRSSFSHLINYSQILQEKKICSLYKIWNIKSCQNRWKGQTSPKVLEIRHVSPSSDSRESHGLQGIWQPGGGLSGVSEGQARREEDSEHEQGSREHLPVCLRTPALHTGQRRKYNDTGSRCSWVQTALASSFQASLRTRSYILFKCPSGKTFGCIASRCFWLHGMRYSTLSRRDR